MKDLTQTTDVPKGTIQKMVFSAGRGFYYPAVYAFAAIAGRYHEAAKQRIESYIQAA
jgi:hypothetical protein